MGPTTLRAMVAKKSRLTGKSSAAPASPPPKVAPQAMTRFPPKPASPPVQAAPAMHSAPAARPGAPAQPHATQAPPPAHAPQQSLAPAPSQGGGLMSTIGGTIIGSVAGHAISNAIFGGSSAPAQEAAAAAPVAAQSAGVPQPLASSSSSLENGPCAYYFQNFVQCTRTNSNPSSCQFSLEQLEQCKRNMTSVDSGM
eukprot:c1580_g1_i1.p1 GENE.c1580_g1_i1~~c1580_g1_i1.p1  ORF type:complete len:197 (+),score=46.36 c1580_g1_i1:1-591(+)